LSIIAGVLGAAGIATIATQRVPQPLIPNPPKEPTYLAQGGLLEGKSHVEGGVPAIMEGGEYVVNKQSTSQFLPLLEAINAKRFQEGGVVGTAVPNIPDTNTDLIDYERLATALAKQPVFASWTEGQNVGRRVRFVESRSSI
jgi:hypothetical protein